MKYLTGDLLNRAVKEKDLWCDADLQQRPKFRNDKGTVVTFIYTPNGNIGISDIDIIEAYKKSYPAQIKWEALPIEVSMKAAWKYAYVKPVNLPNLYTYPKCCHDILSHFHDTSDVSEALEELLDKGLVEEFLAIVNGKWLVKESNGEYGEDY